jgi:hypothetical protein
MQPSSLQAQADLLPEVGPLRQASRLLVRELGFLDDGQIGLGITHSQCHTLIELERSERLTAGELAQALNLDKSTMSRTVEAWSSAATSPCAPSRGIGGAASWR